MQAAQQRHWMRRGDDSHQGCEADSSYQSHEVAEEGEHAGDQRDYANVDSRDE